MSWGRKVLMHLWRHPMETFSALLTLCVGNSPVTVTTELWCFLLICVRANGWANSRYAGVLRHHRVHYDVTVLHKQKWHWPTSHHNVIKCRHFPHYWPFVRGIHRGLVWVNNRGAGYLRHHLAHYNVPVMSPIFRFHHHAWSVVTELSSCLISEIKSRSPTLVWSLTQAKNSTAPDRIYCSCYGMIS